MKINETMKAIHENAIKKGFFENEKNIGEMLCLIHSEVSEALEADRKNHYAKKSFNLDSIGLDYPDNSDNHRYFQQEFDVAIKNSFEDELADVIIRVLDLCAYKNIDIEYHISMKMRYNSLREHKHGKKY
jgi:NTP pyrophosphatase (non-canonical NTP hydrolase)